MFHAQELGSYAQGQGSLAVFKVTARDQGHYKGPSGAFVTYCNISCYLNASFLWQIPQILIKHTAIERNASCQFNDRPSNFCG